jgi:hypothetical protein
MANMSKIRSAWVRLVFVASLVAMLGPGPAGAADPLKPNSTWVGVVVVAQRNVVATLAVGSLQLGTKDGSMRWGTPKVCTLSTEYAGTTSGGGDYVLNVSGTNGGWCDLYRDGALHLHFDASAPEAINFQLTDAHGGQPVTGALAPAP